MDAATESTCCGCCCCCCCCCCCRGCGELLPSPRTCHSGARGSQAHNHVDLCQAGGVGGDAAHTGRHGAHAHVSPEPRRQGRTTRTLDTVSKGHGPTALQVAAPTCPGACSETTGLLPPPSPSRCSVHNRLPNPPPAPAPNPTLRTHAPYPAHTRAHPAGRVGVPRSAPGLLGRRSGAQCEQSKAHAFEPCPLKPPGQTMGGRGQGHNVGGHGRPDPGVHGPTAAW